MRQRGRPDLLFLALVFALALVFRFLSYPAATGLLGPRPAAGGAAPSLRLLSTDCYGHLRRSHSVARNFPRVPVRDPYLNHPDGAVFIWPPLFDLLVGGAARAAFGRDATLEETTRVLAFLPPVLGALHVFPLFLLARRLMGRRRALLAAAAYAVLPSAVTWSQYGHGDHHVAEGLTLLILLATAARASRRPDAKGAALTGLALFAMLMVWQGAVFAAALLFVWTLPAFGATAAVTGLVATGLTALATGVTLAGQDVPFSFVSFGWFQPVLLAAGTLPLALWSSFRARTMRGRLLALALAAGLLVVLVPNAGRLVSATFRGGRHLVTQSTVTGADDVVDGGYLSYPKELLALIAECRPLITGPVGATASAAIASLSPGLLLLPIAMALWARRALRARRCSARRMPLALAVLFAGTLLVMTLLQCRNVYYLGIFATLALADCLGHVRVAWGRLAMPLVLALVLLPGIGPLQRVAAYADAPGRDVLDLLTRLRAFDPPGRDPAALPPPLPGEIPGVMGPWSAGHFVTALSERPAAADTFAYGWRRQCRLFSTSDDAEAEAILRSARCRYLLTTDLRPVLPDYAAAAGRPGILLDSTFAVRVHESALKRPTPFLELVLTSRTAAKRPDGRLVPRFKIYRVLEGGSP